MGGSARAPDPQMGKAAMLSAETGKELLDFMRGQSAITNEWAASDRTRYTDTFQPLENDFIEKAKAGVDPGRINDNAANAANQAVADVRQAFATQRGTQNRNLTAMGVNPNSGRFVGEAGRMDTAEALASAGAGNLAARNSRLVDEAKGDADMANAINLGKGLAVNPATSMGLSNGAASSGYGGAMSGYGQQASILNQDYQNRMATWQAGQNSLGGLMGGLGAIAGAVPWASLSSKDYKTDKKPSKGALEATRKMPVEEWRYKEGIADEAEHIGPYAEDFHRATGKGDGKSIPFQDMLGLTLGAIQDLDKKVSKLEAKAA